MSFISSLWGGGSSGGRAGGTPPPPTPPKRSNTVPLNIKPRPLSPKLTRTPIISGASTSGTVEYPPAHASSSSHVISDSQWEHVKPGSPPSPDPELDEGTFERLGFSQIDGGEVGFQRAGGGAGGEPGGVPGIEEGDRLRQRLETSLATQRRLEPERERSDRKVAELKANDRSERDGSSIRRRSRRERDLDRDIERERDRDRDRDSPTPTSIADTLKEENDKLKAMIQQQVQQMNQVQEEKLHERAQMLAETERLREELTDSDGAHVQELEKLKKTLQSHVLRIEYLTADRERVRKDRDGVVVKMNTEIEKVKQTHAKETETTNAAIEQVRRDHTQAHSELRKVKKLLDDCSPKLAESVQEIERLRRELFNARDASRVAIDLKRRLDLQTKDLEIAQHESSALKKEFNQVMTLLDDRTSELKGAQSFLTTADNFSGAEVTNTLQRLNAEVLQSTAFMAECMVDAFFADKDARGSKTEDQIDGSRRASATIGGVIVHFLGTKHHKEDPILVQIAFQAFLAYHLRWIACAWIIGGDEDCNKFVDTMYQSVCEKEAQAIAGRWRALTRANVPSTPFDPVQLTLQITTKLISGLCDILLAAGSTGSKSDLTAALSSKFTEKLSLLVSLAMRVNKIVGEDVTSGDLEVLAVPPATTFDGTYMEDAYDDGSSSTKTKESSSPSSSLNKPKVLCATDLGLRKKTRIAMTGEKWEIKILLKPKVALESVIDIMDD